jgi:2-amino-4-hydroxy-6-hydroxymethyldihydropteridine diphosphokinase
MAPSAAPAGSGTDAPEEAVPVAIALGSNLGEREEHLSFAIGRLRDFIEHLRVSSFYSTDPFLVDPQPRFLNAAAVGLCRMAPRQLLDRLLTIERERGRERPQPGAPRTLDLDLVLYGELVLEEPGLQVPHPRFRERQFVLEPLADVGPSLRDPVSGLTIEQLLAKLRRVSGPSP